MSKLNAAGPDGSGVMMGLPQPRSATSRDDDDEDSGLRERAPRALVAAERRGIRRHALITRALHQPGIRVVVVQAPAGHGKSTLLEQLRVECEQRGDVTGWLDVGDGDNDIRRFYGHLEAMIASMRAQGGDVPPRAARSPDDGEFRSDWLLAQLRSIGRPASIFLDDAHLVSARQTLALLGQVLSRVPDGVQFFVSGRTLPDLGLPRLTVAGQALVIRANELCFSRDETARYFASVAGLQLSEQELEQIHRQTDGWPAALQLFRLALRHPVLRRDLQRFRDYHPEELATYLAENVLRQQSAGTREFLLLSSTMSRLCGELCDEVLRRQDSAEQLAQLESAGLFLRRIDSEPQWYTYHPLFATFLIDQLRSHGAAQIAALRRRAADWFVAHDRIEDALEHYVAAGDHGAAADALEAWADRLIPSAQLMTVERWSERISLAEIERRPGLLVKIAWALGFLRRHSRLAPLLDPLRKLPAPARPGAYADPRLLLSMAAVLEDDLQQSESLVSRIDVSQEIEPGSFRAFELGVVCNVRGYTAMAAGDFPTAHQFFARSRQLCGPASGASFPWAYCVSMNSLALIQQGQLHEALSLLRTSMADPRMVEDESISQATVVAAHVVALYEADELDEARTQFLRFRDVIAGTALPDNLVVAFIAMSRVQDAAGEQSKALEYLDEAESIAYANRWPRLGAIIGWERVRRELVRGEPERAMAIAERVERLGEAGRGSWVRFSEDVHGSTIGRLRLQAMHRDPDEALRLITTALGSARRKGRVHRQIKLLQLAAVAHHRRNTPSRSQQYLDEALRLAAAGGYLRAFLEEGPLFERALRQNLLAARSLGSGPATAAATPQDHFLAQVTRRLSGEEDPSISTGLGGAARAAGAFQSPDRFTRREQTLLKLLAGMVSTEEMAEAMHLSRDGLKFHLKNIYAKLGVRTRMQAVRAARELEFPQGGPDPNG